MGIPPLSGRLLGSGLPTLATGFEGFDWAVLGSVSALVSCHDISRMCLKPT